MRQFRTVEHLGRTSLSCLALLLTASSCPTNEPAHGIEVEVDDVKIRPSVVHSAPGMKFELRAVLRDKKGYVMPEFLRNPDTGARVLRPNYKVEWEFEASVSGVVVDDTTINGENQHRIVIKTPSAEVPFNSFNIDVMVEVAGKTDTSLIQVFIDGPAQDSVIAPDPGGARPSIVIFSGDTEDEDDYGDAGSCAITDSLIAFAGLALLGDLASSGPCDSRVAVAAVNNAAERSDQDWSGFEGAHFTSPRSLDAIGVAFWLVPETEITEADVRTDLATANQIFRENRTGIAFEEIGIQTLDYGVTEQALVISKILTYRDDESPNCPFLRQILEDHVSDMPPFSQFGHYIINVFYVPGSANSWLGESCGRDVNDLIRATTLIYDAFRLPSTLAHELAHQVLLPRSHYTSPVDSIIAEAGHPHKVDAANLVAVGPNLMGGDNLWAGASRSWLSVGQVFWINWNVQSYIHHARKDPYDGSDTTDRVREDPFWYDDCYADCPEQDAGDVP